MEGRQPNLAQEMRRMTFRAVLVASLISVCAASGYLWYVFKKDSWQPDSGPIHVAMIVVGPVTLAIAISSYRAMIKMVEQTCHMSDSQDTMVTSVQTAVRGFEESRTQVVPVILGATQKVEALADKAGPVLGAISAMTAMFGGNGVVPELDPLRERRKK